jgi:hypothetical protein
LCPIGFSPFLRPEDIKYYHRASPLDEERVYFPPSDPLSETSCSMTFDKTFEKGIVNVLSQAKEQTGLGGVKRAQIKNEWSPVIRLFFIL